MAVVMQHAACRANKKGPLAQADLLALYRRLFAATRALEARDRDRANADRPE